MRYSAEEVERAAKVAGREILLASIFSFLGIALIAPLALILVIRRFERDLRALEAAASHLEDKTDPPMPTGSAFDAAIGNLRTSLKDANVGPRRPAREAGLRGLAPCSRRITSGESTGAWPGVIMVCVVVALAVVSYFSHRVFDQELVPETEQKAATVGASVRALVLKATGYGIEFSQLYGVEQTFAEVFEENPEFAYMAITNTDGNVLFARGTEPIGARAHFRNPVVLQIAHEPGETSRAARVGQQYIVSVPINDNGKPLGVLHVGIDAAFVDHVLLEVLLDVVVVLVVSLFFTLELLNFMAGARLASGLGEFARQVERMRSGDFTATARIRANDEIGRLLRRIDSAIDHLNVRYEFLVGELQDKMRTAIGRAAREVEARAAGLRGAGQAPSLRQRAGGQRPGRDEPESHPRPALRVHPRRGAHALVPAELREPAPRGDPRHLAAGRDRPSDHAVHADRGRWANRTSAAGASAWDAAAPCSWARSWPPSASPAPRSPTTSTT